MSVTAGRRVARQTSKGNAVHLAAAGKALTEAGRRRHGQPRPLDHPLNLVAQSVFTCASWSLTVVLLVVAIRWSLRDRSSCPVLIVLAGMYGARCTNRCTTWASGCCSTCLVSGPGSPRSTRRSRPGTSAVTPSLYAGEAMFICHRIRNGMDGRGLLKAAACVFAASCLFEMIGIN